MGRPRSHPGDICHGLDLLVPQPGDRTRADAGDPRGDIVFRTGRSQHGRERGRAGHRHDPKPRAIRAARRTWRRACRVEGPELSKRIAETKRLDAVLDLVGTDDSRLSRYAAPWWAGLSGRWLGGLAPIADFNPLLQMASGVYLTFFGSFVFGTPGFPLSDVPLQAIAGDVAAGRYRAKPSRVFGFEDIREATPGNGREPSQREDGRGRLSHPPSWRPARAEGADAVRGRVTHPVRPRRAQRTCHRRKKRGRESN